MSLLFLGCLPDTAPELLLLEASALVAPLSLFPPREGPCTDFCFGAILQIRIGYGLRSVALPCMHVAVVVEDRHAARRGVVALQNSQKSARASLAFA
jgi:hypothetical protein